MAAIGFVGLGHMGLPMAVNLLKAGHDVTGYDLAPAACRAFAHAGGVIADDLRALASNKSVIITMLQSGQQVKAVWVEEGGVIHAAAHDTVLIDSSTIDVDTSRMTQRMATDRGFITVDAPVSGGVAGATAGTLTFMVGGTSTAFSQVKPFLAAMGKTIIHAGDAGSGQAAKICNNMILGVSMIAISEAFILAESLGLSADKLFEIVTHASGQCWAMNHYVPVPHVLPQVPANHDYAPGFTADMMLKDLLLSQQAAGHTGVTTPLAHQATALYQAMHAAQLGDLDFSAIIKTLHD